MHFGSDEMMELMLLALKDESCRYRLEQELRNSVKGATIGKLRTGFGPGAVRPNSKPLYTAAINPDDYREIVDTVFCNVVMHLEKFIELVQRKGYVAAQRQHWLNLYIYGAIADYLEQHSGTPYDDTFTGVADPPSAAGQHVSDIVRIVCKADSKAEKKLAFFYNMLVFREFLAHERSGAAKDTANYMNGKHLFGLKNKMVENVDYIYKTRLDDNQLGPLNDELGRECPTEKGKEICEVTPKLVSDWTNRIKTHLFNHADELNLEGAIWA